MILRLFVVQTPTLFSYPYCQYNKNPFYLQVITTERMSMHPMASHVCAPDDISSVNHQTQKSCPHSTFSRLHSFSHFVSAEERNTFSFLRGLNRKKHQRSKQTNIKHLMAIAPNCSLDTLEQAHNSHTIISRRQTYYAYNSFKQVDSPIFIHMLH